MHRSARCLCAQALPLLLGIRCSTGSVAQTRTKKSWSGFFPHPYEDPEEARLELRRYRREVRKYVRKLGPCTDPEQSEAPDPPDKVNWRRPGGGRVPHRSQERNTPKQHAKKRSPSMTRGIRRPENESRSPRVVASGSEMKEALSEMWAAANRSGAARPRRNSTKGEEHLVDLHHKPQDINFSRPKGKTPPKAVKVSFSLQKQFTPLSVDDIRNVLGDAASDPETQKPEHVCDWQDLAEQYVATEVPSDHHSRSNSHRAPRKNSKAAEKRWKGKTKRKGGRAKKLGFEALREEFPGAWFRGKAHRGASKANGFEWAGEGSREGYSSDDEYSLSDGEDDGQNYWHRSRASEQGHRHSNTASQFHNHFRSQFWGHRESAQRSSDPGASKQACDRSDPFVEYIEFKYGGGVDDGGFDWEFFEAFQGPFSDHSGHRGAGGFRFTGDLGGADYTGTYFTGEHSTGTSQQGYSSQHASGSHVYCKETKRHLDVLELKGVPACKTELKQAYLRMAKKHHPDAAAASGGESAGNSTKQFLQAKTAYEYLQEHCTK